MSFESVFHLSQNGNLIEIDNETGNTVADHDLGHDVYSVERDTAGNIYVMDGRDLHKYDQSLTEQWVAESVYGAQTLRMGPNETDIYGAGGMWMYRVDASDGTVVWKSSIAEDDTLDITTDGEHLYAVYEGRKDQAQIDLDAGYESETASFTGENTAGIAAYNGQYLATEYDTYGIYSADSFTEGNTIHSGSIIHYSNLEVDKNAIYAAGTGDYGDGVGKFEFDGTPVWTVNPPGGYYRSIDVSPDSLWVVENDAVMYKLDKSDGSLLWSNSEIGTNYSGLTIGGFPSLDMIGEENYFIPITVSGTVVNGGSGVSGAKVTVIDDTSDEILTTTTTDADGNWSASVPDTRLHVVAQYEDDSGTVYNTTSYPYVNSQ